MKAYWKKAGLDLACAVLLGMVLHGSVSARAASQAVPDSQVVVRPPETAWPSQGVIRPVGFETDALAGEIEINTREKSLLVRWGYGGSGAARVFYREKFDLSFWPTAASCITDARLSTGSNFLVAGKRPSNGHTVIERWETTVSAIPSASTPTAVQRTVIFDANTPGKRIVRKMDPAYGTAGRAFVHFDDSRDLYRLDAATGALTEVLTSIQVPALAGDNLLWFSGGKRTDGSFAYIYQCDPAVYQDDLLILMDLQGDGNIDQWNAVPYSQWSTAIDGIQWEQLYDG
jgi:hypothetical protein